MAEIENKYDKQGNPILSNSQKKEDKNNKSAIIPPTGDNQMLQNVNNTQQKDILNKIPVETPQLPVNQPVLPEKLSVKPEPQPYDLNEIIRQYDELQAQRAEELKRRKKSLPFSFLADLAMNITDTYGADAGTVVNRRQSASALPHFQTQKLYDLYIKQKAARPELAMRVALQKYQNELAEKTRIDKKEHDNAALLQKAQLDLYKFEKEHDFKIDELSIKDKQFHDKLIADADEARKRLSIAQQNANTNEQRRKDTKEWRENGVGYGANKQDVLIDSEGNYTYLPKGVLKENELQLLNDIKNDFGYNELRPGQKKRFDENIGNPLNYVKQNWTKSKTASDRVKVWEEMFRKNNIQSRNSSKESEDIVVSNAQATEIDRIITAFKGNEKKQKEAIRYYLRNNGYNESQINSIIKSIEK